MPLPGHGVSAGTLAWNDGVTNVSPTPSEIEEEAPFFNKFEMVLERTWVATGLEIKNGYAGEGQQQFTDWTGS